MSAISVIELCHGIWRTITPERRERRKLYVREVFSAIPVQPFTKVMGERAAKIDAEARKVGNPGERERDSGMIPNAVPG
jgi:predicted nucleic acid-binding protein